MSTKVWYVEPHDAHTNEVMATEISAEMAHKDMLCQDGKKRDFWECEYSTIAKFLRNKRILGLHFQVYYRENPHGPVKLWPFSFKKKSTIASALRDGSVTQGL